MIGISSCLAGIHCRYDGNSNLVAPLKQLVIDGKAIHFCPEVLGGLATPRQPAEIIGGDGADVWSGKAKVLSNTGEDVTEAFKQGALQALKLAQEQDIQLVILKANSPSCGSRLIYDGSFSRTKVAGAGVTTALFQQHGIQVTDEEHFNTFI